MPHAGAEEAARYGMDSSGDGIMDKAELDAYYEYKAQVEQQLLAEKAQAAAQKAAVDAANASDYETVPGFAARRGWDGATINEHNYAEPLTAQTAVFPFRAVAHGPMAQFLDRPAPASSANMAPRGRSRDGPGFFGPPPQF
jgi:hypothetical protein